MATFLHSIAASVSLGTGIVPLAVKSGNASGHKLAISPNRPLRWALAFCLLSHPSKVMDAHSTPSTNWWPELGFAIVVWKVGALCLA